MDSSIFQPGPTINTGYFLHTAVVYWSSTAKASVTDPAAWIVAFMAGDVQVIQTSYGSNQSYGGYVRAVRGGQTANNFVDNNDGTITDTDTGLMWQKATAPGIGSGNYPDGYTWEQALTYCENLTLPAGGYSDWRLPNRNELQSIVDYSRSNPATTFPDQPFPPPFFYFGVYIPYWSSTTYTTWPDYTGVAGSAWAVEFAQGNVGPYVVKYYNAYVRAVRGGRSWPCPAKTALGEQSRELQSLRTFRDRFMKRSDQGREYAELYYQHAPEISSLLEANPKLKGESRRLILKLLPTVQALLVQKKGIMEAGTVTQVTALLDNLLALGSPSLSADLVQLKKEMQSGRLFEELNISIADGGIHPRLK